MHTCAYFQFGEVLIAGTAVPKEPFQTSIILGLHVQPTPLGVRGRVNPLWGVGAYSKGARFPPFPVPQLEACPPSPWVGAEAYAQSDVISPALSSGEIKVHKEEPIPKAGPGVGPICACKREMHMRPVECMRLEYMCTGVPKEACSRVCFFCCIEDWPSGASVDSSGCGGGGLCSCGGVRGAVWGGQGAAWVSHNQFGRRGTVPTAFAWHFALWRAPVHWLPVMALRQAA